MSKKVSMRKDLVDLEVNDCRWPIGDPRQDGFHFCGARQELGRPYCKEHMSVAVDVLKPRTGQTTPTYSVRRAA